MAERTKTLKKYREMEPDLLTKEEGELRTAIWKLKVQKGTGQIVEGDKLASAKRDLARLLTVRNERRTETSAGKRS